MKIGPREQMLRDMREREHKGLDNPRASRNTTTAGDNRPRNNRAKAHKESDMDTPKSGPAATAPNIPRNDESATAGSDPGPIPPALARPPLTDAEKERLAKRTAAANSREVKSPKVTSPKNAKLGKTGLGAQPAALKKAAGAKKKAAGKKAAGKKAAAKTAKRASGAPKAAGKAAAGGVKPGSKLEKIVKLLKRKEGCTAADALAATGWPSLSFNQQAAAAGIKLRKVKEGRITRYFAA